MPTELIRRGYQATAPNPGTMSVDEGPTGSPTTTRNPNAFDISTFLNDNWQGILVGIGIAAFLFWIFGSKK
ncbi:unnamed protein product [marine sediment metagenome]|uniref:Uncharacterized protein n=1 Tax=marine sediment metagenome TaxID=412755 RepID=X1VRV4_9ZZZZ